MRTRYGDRRTIRAKCRDAPAVAGVVLAAVVAALGTLAGDPVVFPVRTGVVVTLVAVAVLACVVALAARRRLTAAALATAAVFVAWQGVGPSLDRLAVLGRTDAAALAVERRFVVGILDQEAAREVALRSRVGGLFLTRRNVAGHDAADVASWVSGLQAARRAEGLAPLVVAADQEGGPVSHLSPPLPAPAALSSLADLPEASRHAAAERFGADQGAALRGIGVTLDLAPVSDLMPAGPSGVLDLHTRLATRAISADPAVVADVATGFSEGLLDAGVVPTAKHFPGLGGVSGDTHLFAASLGTSEDDLARADWVPFRAVLAVPGAAVMLSHASLEAVDPGVPASRSRRLVQGVLRDAWGFDGIAITDDLTMGAVVHGGLCAGVEGALNAGVDLLLVSWDVDVVYPAIRCALDAADAGRLDPRMMAASARRLDALVARSAGRTAASEPSRH